MDRHYSTLELAQHDETARAPERDYDATAFELDPSALAPQAVPDTTPQVFYDDSWPEAHGNEKPSEENFHITKLTLKWPWIFTALMFAAAIAVGVSVEIWHHREHSLYKAPRVSSPPAPPNSTITPHPNITHAPQYILNDTSLAAVSLSNGDRHLFFQDNTGLIRRAVRTNSNGQWTTSPKLNASADPSSNSRSNPKKHTPLTATGSSYVSLISLYYISENHVLNSSILQEDGSWAPDPGLGNYSTAVDTRSLSISLFPTANESSSFDAYTNSTSNIALLYYENPNGNVSALLHRFHTVGDQQSSSTQDQWVDITSQESKELPPEFRNAPGFNYSNSFNKFGTNPNITFSHTLYEADPIVVYGTPFTSAANFWGSSAGALFYSPFDPLPTAATPLAGGSFFNAGYAIGLSGLGNFSLLDSIPPSREYTSINQSDIATFGSAYGIWINGTQPVLMLMAYVQAGTVPDNVFPFTRLASVTLTDQSATYLYHQMNGTTFAEEQWDNTLHGWLPSEYIIVSDS